jgi:aryl-phospho-beta-D-glucosidase BglC (GH1 family)
MKSIYKKLFFSILAIGLTTVIACKKNGGGNSLSVNPDSYVFQATGGTNSMEIKADAAKWDLSSNVSWIQLSQVTGNKGTATVIVTALSNPDTNSRTATITLSAENAPTVQISVSQVGSLYPSYNTSPIAADATGMSSTLTQLAAKIKLGFNIGNTLEATGGETAWGNPLITKALIDFVKQSGFNAIRLPCSWNQYMSNATTAQLKADWLSRVKDVVQYCVDDNLYVILNIHWDGGWLENNCTVAKQVENNAKQKAFWEQIATRMRDFDEHLLFASANEPNVSNATEMAVLFSYHQTFIDAVRSTGGKNAYRNLVIQGPSTDIEKTNQLMSTLPVDNVSNRMMVEIHYYTPWNFCGMTEDASWGNMFYYWGSGYHSTTDTAHNATWGEEDAVNTFFQSMKTKFVDKGIPVVMGEYGPMVRSTLTGSALTLHLASRAYYLKYVTKQAIANGILPFLWDTGGIIDRSNYTVKDQQSLDALIQGAN